MFLAPEPSFKGKFEVYVEHVSMELLSSGILILLPSNHPRRPEDFGGLSQLSLQACVEPASESHCRSIGKKSVILTNPVCILILYLIISILQRENTCGLEVLNAFVYFSSSSAWLTFKNKIWPWHTKEGRAVCPCWGVYVYDSFQSVKTVSARSGDQGCILLPCLCL